MGGFMFGVFDPASLWAAHPEAVQVLADITSGGDGTSNGAIASLVNRVLLSLGVLLVAVFGWRILSVYSEKTGAQTGPGGGGGGGKDKKLVDELKHFAIAVGLLVGAYAISDIVIDVVVGWLNRG
ncbi:MULTISPECIES: hypothetical protein [Mycobacterium]|uniref:Uncharacterized protein n=2 Tax=Mycobacterium avium complex (MAC) TaxID=120793 RepID=A0AAW5RYD6_MYCBC|nr:MULTISPECIES: hypothetical protein [Mycobacterium]MBZ4632709.1 hypothetical protein [Mycobacterium avium subsp. hominissuis]MCV6988098.1 hypothetical protein [Mycobacterium bouchedurhonense]MCV6995000.1 hypothetical protein [Mycobacterium timonense]MDV3306987.1 hypothetical protein [Mycobacterium avium subsp. hominissuis]QWY65231.1 hypothetical protein BJP78_26295 [Mycobacterium avium subsp. hominissuis]